MTCFTRALPLFLCLSLAAAAEPRPVPVDPAAVGLSATQLQRIGPSMDRVIGTGRFVGAVTAVVRNGKLVHLAAHGLADRDGAQPMKPDTIFRIYSMTKPVTAVAALMLVETGKLRLDDPVEKHIPKLAGLRVYRDATADAIQTNALARPVTVRDLLTHTAGFTYGLFTFGPVDRMMIARRVLDPSADLAAMMGKLAKIPLVHQPGDRFTYGLSSDVLGRVVEKASGVTLDRFFADRIFKPLGMTDTGFSVPAGKINRLAANYGPNLTGGLRVIDPARGSMFAKRPALLSGGGGLVSTADDYLRFCRMLVGGGQIDGVRLLKAETVAAMTTNHVAPQALPIRIGPAQMDGVGFGYGLSVRLEAVGPLPVGEYGWGGAASTNFWISPQDDLICLSLAQRMPYDNTLDSVFKRIVYQALKSGPDRKP